MLRVSWLTSFLAVAVSAIAVMGCSSAPADDSVAGDDDEINSTTNMMGMRLVFDDPSSRVRATVKTKLRAGETLVMRVRRGRIVVDQVSLLDCTQLTAAPPLAAGTYTGSKVVYQGPEVDRTLLASVYSQQWIDGNISQDVLERLSREGTDAIVEACIQSDTAVRVRLQTSIQDAWDAADPNTAPALRAQKLAAAAAPHP